MAGEIATAYVRLRPIADTFRAEAAAQVGTALGGLNESTVGNAVAGSDAYAGQVVAAKRSEGELASIAKTSARNNVESAAQQIEGLKAISVEYKQLARSATLTSDQQRVAANLATEADAKQMVLLGRNVDEGKEHVGAFGDTLKGLAATFGTTIGAIALLNFGKSVISSAAEAQKSAEAISENFGKAGDSIKKFAEGAAANLGLSASTVETTAAQFGIAYKQIGIAQPLAARMTLGFVKLAGAISEIKGTNPATVMTSLSSAAAGNTRALRVLGITIDQSQLKYAALKAGIIDTLNTALTPAQKAEAVYAVATAKLGLFQQEAAKHAGDLSNVQKRLSAEWSNAKGIIGTALLPALTKLATALADWLGKMVKSGALQRDVNTVVRDGGKAFDVLRSAIQTVLNPLDKVIGYLGGLKPVLAGLAGAFLVFKGVTIFVGLAKDIYAAAKALLAFDLAADANPIGLVVIAVSALAAGLYELYQHSATARRAMNDLASDFKKEWPAIRKVVLEAVTAIRGAINWFVSTNVAAWREWGGTITSIAKTAWGLVKSAVKAVLDEIVGEIDVFKGIFEGKWSLIWKGLKDIAKGALDGVWSEIKAWGNITAALFTGIWKNFEIIFLEGVNDMLKPLGSIVGVFTGLLGEFGIHVSNPVKDLQNRIKATIKGIQDGQRAVSAARAAASAADTRRQAELTLHGGLPHPGGSDFPSGAKMARNEIGGVVKQVVNQIRGYWAQVANTLAGWKQEIALKHQFDVGQAIANKIFNSQVKQALTSANQQLTDAIKAGKASVLAATEAGNKAIEAAQQSLNDFQISAAQAAYQAQQAAANRLQAGGKAALSRLTTFGNDLQSEIDKVLGIKFGAQNLSGVGPFSSAAAQIKALLAAPGGPSQALLNAAKSAQAQLNPTTALSASKRLDQAKTVVSAHLALLEQEALKGNLTVKQLTDKLWGYLNKAGLGYKQLVHYVGTVAAEKIRANIALFGKQLYQFDQLPKKMRKQLLAASGGNLSSSVVNIVAIQHANAVAARIREDRFAHGFRERLKHLTEVIKETRQREHKATVNATARVERARTHLADVTARESLDVARHHYAEAKAQTGLLKKIHAVAASTAKTNAILAGTQVNSGFPKSTHQNPGTSAKHARSAAHAGA